MTIDVARNAPPVAVLKALAEPNRWRIVELLSCEELCVCHLADEIEIAQPLVSHHLKVLREAGLVESEKHRQWTYYRLRTGVLDELAGAIGSITSCCPTPGERRRPCE
ncbi:MAG: ArsR/SmtB family transcription factor [Acidimicrobiia bacterium]